MRHAAESMMKTVAAFAVVLLSSGELASCGEGDGAAAGDKTRSEPVVELVADPRTDDPTFFADAPMPFAVRVLLAPAAREVEISTRWHRDAKIEVRLAEPSDGAAAAWHPLATLPMSATRIDDAENPVARLVPEKRGHAAYLVAPPEATAALAPGAYVLRARVDLAVTPRGEPARTVSLDASFPFRVAVAATPDDKMRVALLQSQFLLETDGSIDEAIRRMEEGLGASGRPELGHHLGWLYVRKGDVAKAIECFRAYVAWARASGVPRVKCCGRDVQEIADEIEATLPILEKRLAEEKPK